MIQELNSKPIYIQQHEPDNDIKKEKFRNCWFCDNKCHNFVAICDNCKAERIKIFQNKKIHI